MTRLTITLAALFAVLLSSPASAQCDEHCHPEPEPHPLPHYYLPLISLNLQAGGPPFLPASAADDPALRLPFAANGMRVGNWFTADELAAAQQEAQEAVTAQGTQTATSSLACVKSPASTAQVTRYASCAQQVGGGLAVAYWYDGGMQWTMLSAEGGE